MLLWWSATQGTKTAGGPPWELVDPVPGMPWKHGFTLLDQAQAVGSEVEA